MKLLLATLLILLMPALIEAGEFPVADLVIIEKDARLLHLMLDGTPFRTFKIALGMVPVGDKKQEGDFKTPEGRYILDRRNPDSDYFLSIHISYPNKRDREYARRRGMDPGGDIMIHGQPNGYGWAAPVLQLFSWTDGCIALSDSNMDAIWEAVDPGTPIEIQP